MNTKSGFIPCAGLGSRMGLLGKELPKPLWSIFERSMLEIQISFMTQFGFSDLFANTHHLHKQIKAENEQRNLCLNLLHEKILLGNGGNFHNLKKTFPKVKNILVANPDVFLMLSEKDWSTFLEKSEKGNCLLLLPCSGSYNEVQIDENGYFLKVRPPISSKNSYLTYSGVSLLDLDTFPYLQGKSSFFDTVIHPTINETNTFVPSEEYEYWDFGTLEQYKDNILKLLETRNGRFWDFLISNHFIREEFFSSGEYNSGEFLVNSKEISFNSSLRRHTIHL